MVVWLPWLQELLTQAEDLRKRSEEERRSLEVERDELKARLQLSVSEVRGDCAVRRGLCNPVTWHVNTRSHTSDQCTTQRSVHWGPTCIYFNWCRRSHFEVLFLFL